MQTLNLFELDKNILLRIPVSGRDTRGLIQQKLALIEQYESSLKMLLAAVHEGSDFYVRVNSGCRAGSIVKVSGKQYTFKNHQASIYGLREEIKYSSHLGVAYVNTYPVNGELILRSTKRLETTIRWDERIEAQFDDRKPVKLSLEEQQSLEYLPDYEGPTVYCFSRTKRTPEEIAASRQPDQFKVYDQIGEEIQIGDLFFHGSSNSLTIGKLVKVSKEGSLTYTSFVGGASGRIIAEIVRKNIKNGRPVPTLLKFSKDLGDKLMIFKLSQ